jgi:hypothetical protein
VVYFDEIVNMKAIDPVQAGRERKVDAVIVICLAWNTTQTYSHVLEIDFKLYDTQSGLCSKQGKEVTVHTSLTSEGADSWAK